jgi:hypothetical protein
VELLGFAKGMARSMASDTAIIIIIIIIIILLMMNKNVLFLDF